MKRKILSIVFAGIMSLMLVACGGESTGETSETSSDATASPASDSSSGESASEDVQAIIDRGVLKVGVKNAVMGFGFEDPLTGEYSGLEIELAKALAEKLGVEAEFTAVTAATRTELLDSGDIVLIREILIVYLLHLPSPMREKRAGISQHLIIRIM